jgi:uncharacterized protein YjbI with pentapeptide repeats
MAEETEHTEATGAPDAAAGDAGLTPAPAEPPPLPPTAEALASKAKDLQALRDVVVDAASIGAGLWFSYLFVLLYLLIAAGSVTHRELFLESPVRLPFLNVDLPLLGFFVLGPLIFLIVHAYVLLHFVLLAGKVGDFDAELKEQITDEDVRRRLRRQLPSNIFVQFLAGPREVRTGVLGFLLQLIAQISLVIGPIALLVFFQLQFLPYHDWPITWWHRIAVLADIVLLWTLWPPIARGERAALAWRDLRGVKVLAFTCASLAPALLVFTIATTPDEWPQSNLPPMKLIPWPNEKDTWRLASPYELLIAGKIDFAARKPQSLWSNRLVLPGFDAIDHTKFDSEAKIAAVSETVSLRARDLEAAVLIGATLRKVDFTAAQLRGAQLNSSDLRGAKFECADYLGQQCTQLQGASLDGAWLQDASLVLAQLQGASLNYAYLQGASLVGARLQGASLDYAYLQGAGLHQAQLQGASLDHAELQGALFTGAFVWRADAQESAGLKDARVINPETGPKYECEKTAESSSCDWTPQTFDELKQLIAKHVPQGKERAYILNRFEQRLDPTKALTEEDEMAQVWEAQARSSPNEQQLAKLWREIGCDAEGAPYVLHGLLAQLKMGYAFDEQSPQLATLAGAFFAEANCPGARGLSKSDKATLKEIRDRWPAPARSSDAN